ncbi:MAG: hypothetical protein PHI85_04060 [Victivallaceae bacterium]|nr:hypothetical protein [Victivallaceae bacterium]
MNTMAKESTLCRRIIGASWRGSVDYAALRVCWRVCELGLSAPREFWRSSPARIVNAYNGVGPDRWPRWCRRVITALLTHYEPAAMVHDYEQEQPDKSYWRFTVANARFALNACLIALRDNELIVIMVRRAAVGLLLAALCQLGGWRGYKTAHRKKK